jgi:hypothetical protein
LGVFGEKKIQKQLVTLITQKKEGSFIFENKLSAEKLNKFWVLLLSTKFELLFCILDRFQKQLGKRKDPLNL